MISPIGANVYVNQNAPAASAVQGDAQARAEFASAIAAELAARKNDEVGEVRPPEEAHMVDPDRDGKNSGGSKDDDDQSGDADESGEVLEDGESLETSSDEPARLDIVI